MWPKKQQQLGRGAYGIVRKHPLDPSRVIKTLHAPPTQNETARFNRKREFLRAVDPNEEHFIIGEMIDNNRISMKNGGKSLHRISPEELPAVYNAVPLLLDALCILQNHEVVHGDIKAANIVFDGKRLRIIDFDLMGTFEEYRKDFHKKHNFPGIPRSTYYSVWPPQRFLGNEWFEFAINPNDTSFHLNKNATDLLESILRRQKTPLSRPYIEVFEDMMRRQQRTIEAFDKIDVYGFGLVLNDLFIRNAESPFRNDAGLRKLVFFMTQPDPRQRLDACRAREEWENMARDAMDVQPPARDKRPRQQRSQQQQQRRTRPRPLPRQQKMPAAFPPGGA